MLSFSCLSWKRSRSALLCLVLVACVTGSILARSNDWKIEVRREGHQCSDYNTLKKSRSTVLIAELVKGYVKETTLLDFNELSLRLPALRRCSEIALLAVLMLVSASFFGLLIESSLKSHQVVEKKKIRQLLVSRIGRYLFKATFMWFVLIIVIIATGGVFVDLQGNSYMLSISFSLSLVVILSTLASVFFTIIDKSSVISHELSPIKVIHSFATSVFIRLISVCCLLFCASLCFLRDLYLPTGVLPALCCVSLFFRSVSYILQKQSNKSIVSNEISQRNQDSNTCVLTSLLLVNVCSRMIHCLELWFIPISVGCIFGAPSFGQSGVTCVLYLSALSIMVVCLSCQAVFGKHFTPETAIFKGRFLCLFLSGFLGTAMVHMTIDNTGSTFSFAAGSILSGVVAMCYEFPYWKMPNTIRYLSLLTVPAATLIITIALAEDNKDRMCVAGFFISLYSMGFSTLLLFEGTVVSYSGIVDTAFRLSERAEPLYKNVKTISNTRLALSGAINSLLLVVVFYSLIFDDRLARLHEWNLNFSKRSLSGIATAPIFFYVTCKVMDSISSSVSLPVALNFSHAMIKKEKLTGIETATKLIDQSIVASGAFVSLFVITLVSMYFAGGPQFAVGLLSSITVLSLNVHLHNPSQFSAVDISRLAAVVAVLITPAMRQVCESSNNYCFGK